MNIGRCLQLVKNRTLQNDPFCQKLIYGYLTNATTHVNNSLPVQPEVAPRNFSNVWEYLAVEMGPRRGDLPAVIVITFIYSVLFFTGVVGNVCTCIVIARNKFMHTATNYYLFNLAIADMLLLVIGLPPDLYSIWSLYPWIFGEGFCIARVLFSEISTFTSILTISAFTVERYVAICHPMKAQKMSSLHRAIRVICSTWCIATVCAIPQAIQYGVVVIKDYENVAVKESAMCTIRTTNYVWTFKLSTVIFFVLPMTFISILYTLIAIAIRRSTLSRASMDIPNKEHLRGVELHAQQQARARRSVLKMLVAVVVAFFVCWAPFHAERLMTIYISEWTGFLLKVHKKLFYLSGICYFVSGTINPVLYSIMSLKFRQAFRQTLLQACCRKSPRQRRSQYFSYKFVHRNGHTETSYTSVGPGAPATLAQNRTSGQSVPKPTTLRDHKVLPQSSGRSSSSPKRESLTRSISGSSLKSTDELEQEEDIQQVLFQIKCYDNNRNAAELLIGVC